MQAELKHKIEFGWFMPAGALTEDRQIPVAVQEDGEILATVAEYFDSVWVPDHFYAFRAPADAYIECWTTMAWVAARYPSLKVGPTVLGVGYRNPAMLAKMASTLQALSHGRYIMGIGAGWRGPEYTAYGYPFPAAHVRIQQLDEAVQIMRLMWTQPAPSFQGKHFQIENAYCEPRPNPAIPIMIGGGGEKLMLPLVARLADMWDRYHGGSLEEINLEDYKQKLEIVQRHASEAGRDPSEIAQSYTIESGELPGSSAESANWVRHLQPLVELGVRQFIVGFGDVSDPDLVKRFADEVIAPVRQG